MAHEHLESKKGEKRERVRRIHIEVLDDGSFLYEVCGKDMGNMDRYSVKDLNELQSYIKDDLGSPHLRYPSKEKTKEAFQEVYADEPEVVEKTRKKRGEKMAMKQKIAIALSKARGKGVFK